MGSSVFLSVPHLSLYIWDDSDYVSSSEDLNQSISHAITDNGDIKMEGYLFKRTSNAFKTWVRRWFMIQDNMLVYRKRSKDTLTTMEEDLRLCTVKPAYEIDKRACFEVVSPARSHMLQADSENECQAWMTAIQAAVSKAFRDHSRVPAEEEEAVRSPVQSPSSGPDSPAETPPQNVPNPVKARYAVELEMMKSYDIERITQITSIPGNEKCCDCGMMDPRWASMNLGITLCIECSGIHRSFGVHKSKVRSLTLDAWEPEQLKVMVELGNEVVNSIYEANVDETCAKRASAHCSREIREAWIRAKYLRKAFIQKLPEKVGDPSAKWSVHKRKRRSGKSPEKGPPDIPTEGAKEHIAQGASQDSGLGSSSPDVIVFGSDVPNDDTIARNLDLSSEDSASDADPDSKSVTSLEEMSTLHPDKLLYKAADVRNLPVMLEAVANGANCNWVNEDDDGKTPLIMAVRSGSLAASEFLMLNGAKVNTKDQRGQTPLHHATLFGHTGQVCQFLKRAANQHAVDADGNDPLRIAINSANADIVTLLRLAKLNEEMKETEGMYGVPGDETFNEVFRDFTNMASDDPDRLNRRKYQETEEGSSQ